MNTPPRRNTRPRTPPAPLHGANFEAYSPRRSQRLKEIKSSPTVTIGTLSPPPSSPLAPSPSPKQTKRKARKATFMLDDDHRVVDPGKERRDVKGKGKEKKVTQEDDDVQERTRTRPTVRNAGSMGLPTPAKTPSRKRKLAPEKVASSAQALFPPTEASTSRSGKEGGLFGVRRAREAREAPSTPRRKTNAAGTLRLETEEAPSIEIFTDTVERRPKFDDDPDNPFITRAGEETRSSKRTRQQRADRNRNRLGDASARTDGMVYIFRGKKVFKRFDHLPDHLDRAASEDQDDEEAGFNPAEIKPRLLFPQASSGSSKAPEVAEEDPVVETEVDEEAETDIDEKRPPSRSSSIVVSSVKSGGRPSVSRMTPDSEDEVQPPKASSFKARLAAASSSSSSKKRLSGSKALLDEGESESWLATASKSGPLGDEEVVTKTPETPKKTTRGVKRRLETGLNTPSSSRKRTRRALY